jgi:hypothetical protein
MTKVARKPKKDSFVSSVRQLLTLRVQREALEERESALKKDVQEFIDANGYEDDKGHIWFDLDEPLDIAGFGTVKQLKRERRVSVTVDDTQAEAILQAKGIYDDCTTTIVVLDEEEIRKAHFKGLLTDADIDAIFPPKVSWAFRPVKA